MLLSHLHNSYLLELSLKFVFKECINSALRILRRMVIYLLMNYGKPLLIRGKT